MCINNFFFLHNFKIFFVFREIRTMVNFFQEVLQANNTWFLDSKPFSKPWRASNWNPREKNLSVTWRDVSPSRTITPSLVWPLGDLALDRLRFLSRIFSAGSRELASFKRYLEIVVCARSGVGAVFSFASSLLSKLSSWINNWISRWKIVYT